MIPHTDTPVPCTGQPELFFGPDGEKTRSPEAQFRIQQARTLCVQCPVWRECRESGRNLAAVGVWGGEDDLNRAKALGRRIRARAALPPAEHGTEAGARRHQRNGEPACWPCAEAARSKGAERRAKTAAALAA